jgi:hypothetical protein
MVVSTLALNAPILWVKLKRRVVAERASEERQPSRLTDMGMDAAKDFAAPCVFLVAVLVGREIVLATGIEGGSAALTNILRFVGVLLAVPFLRAARQTLSRRPFVLSPTAQAVVCAYDTATLAQLNWKLFFTAVSVVALSHPLLYCLQILAVLKFSPTLRNVVKAVQGPIVQLGMTCFLGILVIHIFMVTAFWAFPDDLTDKSGYYGDCPEGGGGGDDDDGSCAEGGGTMCSSMISCVAVFLVNGLTTGGGIGEFISSELGNAPPLSSPKTLARYAFDLAFFVVVTIGLLNLIFGIIIDTFSSLRERANEKKSLMESKCTVCGLTRQEFERKEPGAWRTHYKAEHNVWAYYSFVIHLQTKPPTEFTGLEDYVSTCLRQRNLTWLPRHTALALAPHGTGVRAAPRGDAAP